MANNYGPKVQWEQMQEGVRIYYTGDMANSSGSGVIAKAWHDEKWNYRLVDVTMDDGRTMRSLHLANFQPAPGRRFWLESDWLELRRQRIAEMQAQWAHLKRA